VPLLLLVVVEMVLLLPLMPLLLLLLLLLLCALRSLMLPMLLDLHRHAWSSTPSLLLHGSPAFPLHGFLDDFTGLPRGDTPDGSMV
jgi:hypothetical protein